MSKYKIPTHDPYTGEPNPHYEELTGKPNPVGKVKIINIGKSKDKNDRCKFCLINGKGCQIKNGIMYHRFIKSGITNNWLYVLCTLYHLVIAAIILIS